MANTGRSLADWPKARLSEGVKTVAAPAAATPFKNERREDELDKEWGEWAIKSIPGDSGNKKEGPPLAAA